MPSDKINVLECLVRAQHFQRIATKCVVFIEHDPFEGTVKVTIISEQGDIYIYKFSRKNMENEAELQRLNEKFSYLNGLEDD